MKSNQQKREEGDERNAAYRLLTTAQKIALLDKHLGPGQGATRQRVKFAALQGEK